MSGSYHSGSYPSRCYPCLDHKDPIQLVYDQRKASPNLVTKVFIEVEVRVYRTKSGLLLNHLHVSSPSQVRTPYEFLLSWRFFQIEIDDLLAKDVFHNCCDSKSLSSMYISTNIHVAASFFKFFKRRVSSFCNKKAANIIDSKEKLVEIVARITNVRVYDLDEDREALYSSKFCGKICIRKENPYGATRRAKDACLFSNVHGSLAYTDCFPQIDRQSCAVCLNELLVGRDDVIIVECDHAFHSKCLIPWFNKVGTCPVCRRILKLYVTREVPAPIATIRHGLHQHSEPQ